MSMFLQTLALPFKPAPYPLRRRRRRRAGRLMQEFEQLLEERAALGGVTAGQTLRDVDVLLAGRRCYAALAPDDRQAVYDGHQVRGVLPDD